MLLCFILSAFLGWTLFSVFFSSHPFLIVHRSITVTTINNPLSPPKYIGMVTSSNDYFWSVPLIICTMLFAFEWANHNKLAKWMLISPNILLISRTFHSSLCSRNNECKAFSSTVFIVNANGRCIVALWHHFFWGSGHKILGFLIHLLYKRQKQMLRQFLSFSVYTIGSIVAQWLHCDLRLIKERFQAHNCSVTFSSVHVVTAVFKHSINCR